jgi:mannose-6-phosphate isomerase-like protein (cupin superfamily)
MSTREAQRPGIAPADSVRYLIVSGTLPGTDRAEVFEGREHGEVPVSMFLVHNRPGDGPELHRHPYAEVFVVHAGHAGFQLEDDWVNAGPGDVVIAPAGMAHRFTNAGAGELSMTCIHAASEMNAEWLSAL